MWIRTTKDQIFNLKDVRLLKIVEGKNEAGDVFWTVQASFSTGEKAVALYISKDREAMENVLENFEKVLGAGRVIRLNKEDEEVSDA